MPKAPRSWARRLLIWGAEIIGGLIALTILVVAVIAVRLEMGPISVDWLTPTITAALAGPIAPWDVAIGKTALRWSARRSPLEIVASDVVLTDPGGHEVVRLPGLAISLDLQALLRGDLSARRIVLAAPALKILRNADGKIQLDLGSSVAPSTGDQSVAAILAVLARGPALDSKLGYLGDLAIEQAAGEFDDQTTGVIWRLTAGALHFHRVGHGLAITVTAKLALGAVETEISGEAHYTGATQALAGKLTLGAVNPAQLAAALPPDFARLAALNLPLALEVDGAIDLASGQVGAVHASLTGGAGTLIDPALSGGKLDLTRLKLDLLYDPAAQRLTLNEIAADLGGPSITGHGAVDGVGDLRALPSAPLALKADMTLHALPLDRVAAFWPAAIAPNARQWITGNLSLGAIEALRVEASASLDPGSGQIQPGAVNGSMIVRGASVDYLHGLPKLTGVDGTISFTPQRMDVTVTSGRLKGIVLGGGSMAIDFTTPVEHMALDVAISGPARDVALVLDSKPLGYVKSVGLDADTIGGTLAGTLHFAFPLKQDLPFAEVDYSATAKLVDLAAANVAFGRDLSAGAFSLNLDRDSLSLEGNAKLDNIPATLSWRQRLSGHAGPRSSLRARATLDTEARGRLGLDPIPDLVQGAVTADIVYTELDDHHAHAVLALDLAGANLVLPYFGWQKAPGPAGHADFTLDLVDDRVTRLDELQVRAPGLDLAGSMQFAGDILSLAQIARLRTGGTDIAGTVEHKAGRWRLNLHGAKFDLAPVLKQLDQPDDPNDHDDGPVLAIDLHADTVAFGPHRDLRNVAFNGLVAHHRLDAADLTAGLGAAGTLSFRLDRPEEGGHFTVQTDDYGALLHVTDISDDIVGGRLAVSGDSRVEGSARRFTGIADGRDYRLTRAPFMARLLSLASFTSLVSLLSGDGLPFTLMHAEFSLYQRRLTLTHARAFGGAIGINVSGWLDLAHDTLSLDGTLVPAYTLNSFITNVPVLGELLAGGEGQGIFAANFKAAGPWNDPRISLNPLSALAPGFLRRLFPFDAPSLPDPKQN